MIPTQAVRRVRRNDPGTSFEAAVRADSVADCHQYSIVAAMSAAGRPVGAEEIGDATGLEPYQIRKRLPELQAMAMVRIAPGERKTRSGRTERLWELTQGAAQ